MRPAVRLILALLLVASPLGAQVADSLPRGSKTFLTRRDLAIAGVAFGATSLLSIWDDDIAIESQKPEWQSSSLTNRCLPRHSRTIHSSSSSWAAATRQRR